MTEAKLNEEVWAIFKEAAERGRGGNMTAEELRPLLKARSERENLRIQLAVDLGREDGDLFLPPGDLAVVACSPDFLPRSQMYAWHLVDPDAPVEPQLDGLVAMWRKANA